MQDTAGGKEAYFVVPHLCKQTCNFFVETINCALLLRGIFVFTGVLLTTYLDDKNGILLVKCNLYSVILSVLDPRKCEYLKDY